MLLEPHACHQPLACHHVIWQPAAVWLTLLTHSQINGWAAGYESTGNATYSQAISNFLDFLLTQHSWPTGGSNANEHWGDPMRMGDQLKSVSHLPTPPFIHACVSSSVWSSACAAAGLSITLCSLHNVRAALGMPAIHHVADILHPAGQQFPNESQETCTSYNLMKLLDAQFRWTLDPTVIDKMERLQYGSLIGTQRLPPAYSDYGVYHRQGFPWCTAIAS